MKSRQAVLFCFVLHIKASDEKQNAQRLICIFTARTKMQWKHINLSRYLALNISEQFHHKLK